MPGSAFQPTSTSLRASTAAMLFVLSSWATGAHACRGPFPTVDQYIREAGPASPIFIGTVTAVKVVAPAPLARHQVTFKVERSFAPGFQESSAIVQTLVTSAYVAFHLDPCPVGGGQLHAAVGQRWLIFGSRERDLIDPNMRMSRQITDAGPDSALLAKLNASRARWANDRP